MSQFTAASLLSSCTSSELGYLCKMGVGGGLTLHYSIQGGVPSNACTSNGADNGVIASSNALHMALSGAARSFMALSFSAAPGTMGPAHIIAGWVDSGSGGSAVKTYWVRGFEMDDDDEVSPSWAENMGVVSVSGWW